MYSRGQARHDFLSIFICVLYFLMYVVCQLCLLTLKKTTKNLQSSLREILIPSRVWDVSRLHIIIGIDIRHFIGNETYLLTIYLVTVVKSFFGRFVWIFCWCNQAMVKNVKCKFPCIYLIMPCVYNHLVWLIEADNTLLQWYTTVNFYHWAPL